MDKGDMVHALTELTRRENGSTNGLKYSPEVIKPGLELD